MDNYDYCLDGTKFYPYKDQGIYWETFSLEELENYAKQATFDVLMSGEGEIYVPEDGIVLHCRHYTEFGIVATMVPCTPVIT